MFEQDENRVALKFGQAIRGGDISGVKQFVDQKGAAEALKIKFSFEIMVQRLVVVKSGRCLPPAMESVTIQVVKQDFCHYLVFHISEDSFRVIWFYFGSIL